MVSDMPHAAALLGILADQQSRSKLALQRRRGTAMHSITRAVPTAAAVALACSSAHAQSPKQVVKPPVSQAWIDVATFSGFAMGGMGPGMLRAIAYGTELNMAYPPRPTDPAVAWEPDWNVKIRVKSMTTAMMGMEGSGMPGMGGGTGEEEMTDAPAPANGQAEPATEEPKKKRKFNPLDVVKDVVKSPLP